MGDKFDDFAKKRNKNINKLKTIEDDSYLENSGIIDNSFLPSLSLKTKKKKTEKEDINNKNEEKVNNTNNDYDPDDWFNDMLGNSYRKVNASNKKVDFDNMFAIPGELKKKKKKKKGKNEPVDYKKEFAVESTLYNNLLKEQQKYVASLQKEYDAFKSTKSSSRGFSKQMTDLMQNITSARSLSMQLIDKQVNIKKHIADLTLKQKRELGGLGDDSDITAFGSQFIKDLLSNKQALASQQNSDVTIADYGDGDDLFDDLNITHMNDDNYNERSSEVDLYLKYENSNITIYASIHNDDPTDFNFIAKDEEGNVIDDYPLPERSRISVNRSTNIATDEFGDKYQIIWD